MAVETAVITYSEKESLPVKCLELRSQKLSVSFQSEEAVVSASEIRERLGACKTLVLGHILLSLHSRQK